MATEADASIGSQLSAISIAPKLEGNAAAPGLATSSPSPSKHLSEKKNEGVRRGIAAGDISSPRKSWKNPKSEIHSPLENREVAYLEEPISAWPLPSCDGISKKKQPLGRRQELHHNVDLHDVERNQIEVSDRFLPVGNISSAIRPPLLPAPRPQRDRPPARNPRRGRIQNHQHFNPNFTNTDYSRNHQQQRPRHPLKPHFPLHQQPNHPINHNIYPPMENPITSFPNFSPDWGFNSVPIPQWTPNLLPSASYFVNSAPSQDTMLLYGYLPSPPFMAEGFPYHVHPISPIMLPPPVWNQPGFQNSSPPPAKAPFQEPLAIYQAQDNDLYDKLRRQIEYYFSDENLMKDGYLKQCMDDQGWISVHTIAMFPRVQVLTSDVNVVMAALQNSSIVEVSGNKMRRRGEWSKWVLQTAPTTVNDQQIINSGSRVN